MRKMKIVADSACDLLALTGAELAVAPLKIVTDDGMQFVDDSALDVDLMVDRFYRYKGKSRSSCPNTGDWLEAFGDADDIVCVTITSGLSGSYNSACAAKQIYESEHVGRRVCVVDSLSAGAEITLLVEKLAQWMADGIAYEEICTQIEDYRRNTGLLFMLKSLKNFANNGRVSPLVAKLVGIAGICIVGKASEAGTLEPMHKCRGETRSLETLVKALETEGFDGGKISIGHCQNEAAALRLKELISERFEGASVEVHPLRGLCSFYAEKGGVLVGFEKGRA